jgi:hypothetical protein
LWSLRVPSRPRRSYGKRTCPTCGNEFEATHHNQRFCPPTPQDRAKTLGPRTQVRSWCAKAFENAMRRGTLEQLLDRARANGGRLQQFNCALCGKRCEPGIDVSPHASTFCSVAHKKRFHYEQRRAAG